MEKRTDTDEQHQQPRGPLGHADRPHADRDVDDADDDAEPPQRARLTRGERNDEYHGALEDEVPAEEQREPDKRLEGIEERKYADDDEGDSRDRVQPSPSGR